MVELATPIRLYWDLAPDMPAGREMELPLCAEVISGRFLSIHLRETGHSLSPGLLQALDLLVDPGRALMLSTTIEACSQIDALPVGLRQLVITAESQDDLQQIALLQKRFAPQALSISFSVPVVPLMMLPGLLTAAIHEGLTSIHFPMQRLTSGEPCWTPPLEELDLLAKTLSAAPLPETVRLTIHDPFLWRAFHPTVPFPDGGCQAANTMLYLSPEGRVYPCPMVPVPLGSIQERPLIEIVRDDEKQLLRAHIRQIPALCEDCAELAVCHAGCRGRAFVMTGWQGHDPACGR